MAQLMQMLRSLKAHISDAVARCIHGHITDDLIAERLTWATSLKQDEMVYSNPIEALFGRFPTLNELADFAIDTALNVAENNQCQAARLLGISRQVLHK